MNINWNIEDADILRLKEFVRLQNNPLVSARILRNINKEDLEFSKDAILKCMIMCLLTSQQRSGPNTPIERFLHLSSFPLSYKAVKEAGNVKEYTKETLLQNGLNRFTDRIPTFFDCNFQILEVDNWESMNNTIAMLTEQRDKSIERMEADKIDHLFMGFGPKQSRNFLQALGLTRFEIPLDSRIVSWFTEFGFPITLSSKALQDKEYYHFVLDGIQQLCERADIYPSVLDAAIFSGFDKGRWTEENVIY